MKQYQREIDELGRVVIPKEVREALGFEPKKTVGITLLDDVIVITPKGAVCSICGKPILAKAKYKLCADCDEYFAMIMLVSIEGLTVDFAKFAEAMSAAGEEAGVDIRVMHEDIFNTMHRI